jgi:hypothetical protein
MRTVSKVVLSVVLVSLLAAWAETTLRRARVPRNDNGRHAMRVRLRRSRQSDPTRRPFVPITKAAIPPEDDDKKEGSRARSRRRFATYASTVPQNDVRSQQSLRFFSPRQRIPDEPLYRTLCLLLI